MIEVQKMILNVMKREIFAQSDAQNQAARSILAELKTKQIDLRTAGPIDAVTQNKLLAKMKSDRENSAGIYRKAGREELAAAEQAQADVCAELMKILEPELPKMMSEAEVRAIIEKVIAETPNPNMGIVMKAFAGKEADRKMVSQIAGAMLKK